MNRVRLVRSAVAAVHPACLAASAAYGFADAWPRPWQHRHVVAPALAFRHALLTRQRGVARLRRQLAAAGGDDQAQRVGQVVMARLAKHGSSWLPSRRPARDALRQQLLCCMLHGSGARQRQRCCLRRCQAEATAAALLRPACGRPRWRSASPPHARAQHRRATPHRPWTVFTCTHACAHMHAHTARTYVMGGWL